MIPTRFPGVERMYLTCTQPATTRHWTKPSIPPGSTPRTMIARGLRSQCGFTILELMVALTIILILATFAVPNYRTSLVRAREAVLRDNLFTLRSLIDQYTLDKKQAPDSLEELVVEGYLRNIPEDPFTGSNRTWQEQFAEDVFLDPDQTASGVVDVRSGSEGISLDGTSYSNW